MNSAVFYVLKGRGHDGKRFGWKAGDLMLVENGCVHEHFNDDSDNDAHLLVFKAKPLFLPSSDSASPLTCSGFATPSMPTTLRPSMTPFAI